MILSRWSSTLQCLLLLFIISLNNASHAKQEVHIDAAKTSAEDAGRRIYRDGLLPNGKPLTAIVAGDVAVLGTQFSCGSCHGRSGMGAAEANIIVPAIAGPILYAPSPQPKRLGYDIKSLARALRDGVSPSGRSFNTLMPRFKLSNNEIKALAAYLKGLSTSGAPGVDDKTIRFATVVTDSADADRQKAVIKVLQTYVNEKNRQTRLESQRPDRGSTPASRLPPVFRKWILDVWVVKGKSESWPEQLEKYYQTAPVFALLGGIAMNNWKPMGQFCQQHEIPCLLPSTNLPYTDKGNFYSVHFSEGLILEAKLIANHALSHNFKSVIQVYCASETKYAADALSTQLKSKNIKVQDIVFECQKPVPVAMLKKRIAATADAAIMLWLNKEKLIDIAKILPADRVYMSSTLLKAEHKNKLPALPVSIYLAHPFRLPNKTDTAFLRFKLWARLRKIDIRYPRLQSEAFFACLIANDVISHLGRFLIRDYFLDVMDHAQAMTSYMPVHPRPTIGPGQRFLTKGGYVLKTQNGKLTTKDAAWISP